MIINPKILTLEEYSRVVEAKLSRKDFKIVSLKEARLEQRVGFLADHSRVLVEVELPDGQHQTHSFFAKAMPSNEICRDMILENRCFQKEIFFYEQLSKLFDGVPLTAKTFPTCYLAKPEVLILDDLGPMGFAPVKSMVAAVDLEHSYQAIAALARFHCASMAVEERLQKRLPDMFPEYMYEVLFPASGRTETWWRMGLRAARALLPLLPQYKEDPGVLRRLQDKFDGLGDALLKCFQADPRRRNVMCHGDAWISNFLFKQNQGTPDHAVLLDFQLMRYAPPVYDVQLFLHKSLPHSADRAAQMEHLLQYYYARLQGELRAAGLDAEALLSEDEFRETSRDGARMASIVVALYSQTCDMPAEFIDKLFADKDLYQKYMFEERPEYVTKVFNTNKHFRCAMGNALGHLAKMVLADE
ncbi:uncharacterized protein LOC117646861 [Thrips palmi]|uniref:Uncharacterized protein LOC117646861 n=1 Tax=Thrips palmi TaxID=161013 RepID=A0A6P8ZPF9_THRPL|nr:uncharacterized protein LOC117646861 [Thrips palmi]